MKNKLILFTFCLITFFNYPSHSTSYTVNNAVNGIADYSTLSAAYTAANAGDTIYVLPSSVSYGGLTLNKPIVLIGSGTWPEGQAGKRSIISELSIAPSGSNMSGTVINGFEITGTATSLSPSIRFNLGFSDTVTNITIENNKFNERILCYYGVVSNVIIKNNLFTGYGRPFFDYFNNIVFATQINWVISNNIFYSGPNTLLFNFGKATTSGSNILSNNIIYNPFTTINPIGAIQNTTVINNIFLGGGGSAPAANCIISNNLFYGPYTQAGVIGSTSTGNNNLFGTSNDPQFVEVSAISSLWNYSPSTPYTDFHLQSTSPAKGSGTNGIDMGIYAGSFPWVDNPAGQQKAYYPGAKIPEIYEITSPAIATPNSTIQIQIKARNAN